MKSERETMWKMSWLTAICLFVFVLLMGGIAHAQEGLDGKIDGFVFHDSDKDGAYEPEDGEVLLPNVRIIVQYDSTGQVETADTDVRGGYVFTGLALDELYTVQVDVSTLPSDKFPLATAGTDSIGAIAWVVFLSSAPAEPNTVVLPSEANISFGFGEAKPTSVMVNEIGVTAVSWVSVFALFTILSGVTRFAIFD